MLDHADAGGGHDQGGGGADVERAAAVAPGAAGVEHLADVVDGLATPPHDGGGGGQLLGRLALGGQGDEDGGHLDLAAGAGQERLHDRGHLPAAQVAALEQRGQCGGEIPV